MLTHVRRGFFPAVTARGKRGVSAAPTEVCRILARDNRKHAVARTCLRWFGLLAYAAQLTPHKQVKSFALRILGRIWGDTESRRFEGNETSASEKLRFVCDLH